MKLKTIIQRPLRNWFRKKQRRHDPLLVLNMSIFNTDGGRIFIPVPQRDNVWC